jgi:hypothetical protein
MTLDEASMKFKELVDLIDDQPHSSEYGNDFFGGKE